MIHLTMGNIMRNLYNCGDSFFFGGKALPMFLISRHAPVFAAFWFDYFRYAEKISMAVAKHEKPVFIFVLGYHCETQERLEEIKSQVESVKEQLQKIEMIFLSNTEKETKMLEEAGFRAVQCNQNAFLDENRYPIIKKEKQYDAIYLARFTPCKRQPLACEIPRLKLIGSHLSFEKDYFESSLKTLAGASWTEKIPARQVPSYFAEAHVGLCLSDVEGAMYVSCEYLLCGLPVVSTPSLGGRDEFFDPDWVSIVEPDPKIIASAVEDLRSRNISPYAIRQGAIAKMHKHRMQFISLIQEIYNDRGITADFSREWNSSFVHKLGLRTRVLSFKYGNRILRESRPSSRKE